MLTSLRRAVALLTLVPVGRLGADQERPRVAGWFPAVGVLLGIAPWAFVHLLESVGWYGEASLVFAAVIVAYHAWITRSLHFDGVADVADAWWGGHTPQRRLEIMDDVAVGAFGATAVSLVVALQVTSVNEIIVLGHALPLLVVPSFGRLAATFSAWLGKPAREAGLGRSVMGAPGLGELIAAGVVIGAAAGVLTYAYGVEGVLLAAGGVLLALVVPHVVAGRMGGVTGDVMGASVLIVETLLYAGVAVGYRVF